MIYAAVNGFSLGFSLILAIGAQNAFILRQGLARQHVLPVVLFAATSDAILVALGVAGFGGVLRLFPALPDVMAIAGAAFLFVYGALRLRTMIRGGESLQTGAEPVPLRRALALCFGFTWANPHVYLDTVGLIGAVSTKYPGITEKAAFGLGAILASFGFFFSLGFGARMLAPIMRSPRAWRVLDGLIAAVMLTLAVGLLRSAL